MRVNRRRTQIGPIIDYWREAAREVFPNIRAHWTGWGEPFCFRCGWLAPLPDARVLNRWDFVGGWLELAHLHDFSGGGPTEPANIVPLCELCHHAMPEYPDGPEKAIAWVAAGQPISCSKWWQDATDLRWGGDSFWVPYPGWTALYRYYHAVNEAFTAAGIAYEPADGGRAA